MKSSLPLAACLLLVVSIAPPIHAIQPTQRKLLPTDALADSAEFGSSIATNRLWTVVGAPNTTTTFPSTGALHVFDTRTGKRLRTLVHTGASENDFLGYYTAISGNTCISASEEIEGGLGAAFVFDLRKGSQTGILVPPTRSASDAYGTGVAMDGGWVLISAIQDDAMGADAGAVHVFDLATGAHRHKLTAPDGAAFQYFGMSLAVEGDLALIGAPQANGSSGKIYVFDLRTGLPIRTLDSPAPGAQFGGSVALRGGWAAIGAYSDSEGGANAGAVYLYDVRNDALGPKIVAPDTTASAFFGASVALENGLLAVGQSGDAHAGVFSGAVWVFDSHTRQPIQRFTAPDAAANTYFGGGIALNNGQLTVTATGDDEAATDAGSVYTFSGLAGRSLWISQAETGQFAPNASEGTYRTVSLPSVSTWNHASFIGTLTGTGITSRNNLGLWGSSGGPRRLIIRAGQELLPGVEVAGFGSILAHGTSHTVFEATLRGAQTTGKSRRAIVAGNNVSRLTLLRSGTPQPLLGGLPVRDWSQVVSETSNSSRAAAACRIDGAPRDSDSAHLITETFIAVPDPVTAVVREGDVIAGPGITLGQLMPRVSMPSLRLVFSSAVQGPVETNQALFTRVAFNNPVELVVKKGDPAPDLPLIPDAAFASFLGETGSTDGLHTVFRATLSGTGITSKNREGLWINRFNADLRSVVRLGDAAPGLPSGVTFRRLVQYVGCDGGHVMFLAQLGGKGISAANDLSLWMLPLGDSLQLIFREGDPLPGENDTIRIGTIQRLELESNQGRYAAVVSLIGSPATTNQVLLSGGVSFADASIHPALRTPFASLRKGALIQRPLGSATSATSINLSTAAKDSAGACAKGLPQSLTPNGTLGLTAIFKDRSTQVLVGQP
ncbi:MAG: FG-GAP repeat protein [Verrucomicrobiae bacterium]|nr:FG-GAP repeat protein [Verrucomicrobiae bacterium]